MKKIILVIIALGYAPLAMAQNGQISLPADPVRVTDVHENNWLKKSTESFLNGEGNVEYGNLFSPLSSFFSYKNALTLIARDENASATVFNWAKPAIRWKIDRMQLIEKIRLHLLLKHLAEYLSGLDEKKEMGYMKTQEGLFASHSQTDFFDDNYSKPFPDVICVDYRDSEALLFRRIKDGVNPGTILRYVKAVDELINVNITGTFTQKCNDNLHEITFTWVRDHFEGDYRNYSQSIGFSTNYQGGSDGKYYLEESGDFHNGLRVGTWKYYEVLDNSHILNNEVKYQEGQPITVTQYSRRELKDSDDNNIQYSMILALDLQKKMLTADVYKQNQFFLRASSLEDHLDYWDFFGTIRLIEEKLPQPQLLKNDLALTRTISSSDKPKVQRNQNTGDYVIYDKLKRNGKDHALFLATDNYENQIPLRNPVHDAEFIAENLKTIYGFNSEIIRDPDKINWIRTLQRYKRMHFENDEQLLIYITGHGSYVSGDMDGYILPKDGKQIEDDVNHESWLSYAYLLDNIDKIPCKHILLMIDACYSGALILASYRLKSPDDEADQKTNNTINWFFGKIQLTTKSYITSTTADRQATDGINHSPFTIQFIYAIHKMMESPSHIMTLHELFGEMEGLSPSPTIKDFKGNEPGSTFFFIMQ